MARIQVIDTFSRFQKVWRGLRLRPREQQIDGWAREYLRPWPDLLTQQIDNYRREGVDWRSVARRRIFPYLSQRVPSMERIRGNLVREIPVAVRKIDALLGIDFPLRCVIYVGIGCGAGWATQFRGTPAILFGLENAAELGWTDRSTARALITHELAHLVHARWRSRSRKSPIEGRRGPWWNLYVEGYATQCELRIGGTGRHHSVNDGPSWLPWCRENRRWLAREFLRTVDARRSTRRFFGSWYPLRGQIETGYFLGSEVVRDWERTASLRTIALRELPKIRREARASLEQMAR